MFREDKLIYSTGQKLLYQALYWCVALPLACTDHMISWHCHWQEEAKKLREEIQKRRQEAEERRRNIQNSLSYIRPSYSISVR